ncbi:hypothetical protein COPEUT_00379 [Coprococcus eutactus ATCC 27759]|nr:hypothetical protein COPEUT_00379 [Coprococcus eutactus ATCC 27759]
MIARIRRKCLCCVFMIYIPDFLINNLYAFDSDTMLG